MQKHTLYDIFNNFKCNDNIIHININESEGTYNIGDKLNCIFENGEFDYTIVEIQSNYNVVDKNIESGDIFTNEKIVGDFKRVESHFECICYRRTS